MEEFESGFERNLAFSLRASQVNEVEELYEKLASKIQDEEHFASVLGARVWVRYDPIMLDPVYQFEPVIAIPLLQVDPGKPPQEVVLSLPGQMMLRASDFRRMVEALIDELKRAPLTANFYAPAASLIRDGMRQVCSSGVKH